MTELENGDVGRSTAEVFRSQSFATAVYQSSSPQRPHWAIKSPVNRRPVPTIVGYTENTSKPPVLGGHRSSNAWRLGRSGARQLAAHQTREAKVQPFQR